MYANTKKELFLGKRPFTAKKMSPEELLDAMVTCIANSVDMDDYEYEEADMRTGDIQEDVEILFCVLRDIIDEGYDGSIPMAKILLKDLNVDGAQLAGGAEEEDWIEIVTLDNGFTYIKVLSVIGDESLVPVYVVLYMGEDDMIHGFIPMCGNNVFAGTDVQLGAVGGNDADAWDALLTKHNTKYNPNNTFDYGKACFETYAKEYGVERTPNDDDYQHGEYVETMLELNDEYIKEDILSNVTLV